MFGQRVKKLILIRLLFASFLIYCPKIFLRESELPFYIASLSASLASAVYFLWYLLQRRYYWLALVQIVGDILLETYLISFTGGAESLFAVFYPLSILSAALVIGRKEAVILTTILSCIGYASGSLLARAMGMGNLVLIRDGIYFYYGTLVRITIFVIVGYLSRHLIGTIHELQDRLKLSERLSLLGEVVSKIAHEIRNPLSSIRTAAEVLRDSLKGKLSAQDEKMLSIVDKESERLTKTLQRILNYAKEIPPEPRMLLLDTIVGHMLDLVQLHFKVYSNGIMVEKKYDTLRTHIYVDEEQVLSALLNLTLNAFQAMPAGGKFSIYAVEEARGTRLDLADTGGGIPKEKMKDLFVPFKSTKKGGTGLGLAEVQKIVTLHEGKIEVESQSGRGTVFHLYFPKP